MADGARQPTIRTVAKPSNINHNGHIFGGWILSQMDVAGGVAAGRRAGGAVATVAIEAMTFHRPVLATDWLSVYTEISAIGRTSITVEIEVKVMRRGATEEVTVTRGTFIYVRIDGDGRPLAVDSSRLD